MMNEGNQMNRTDALELAINVIGELYETADELSELKEYREAMDILEKMLEEQYQ